MWYDINNKNWRNKRRKLKRLKNMERNDNEMINEDGKNLDTIEKIDILGMSLENLQEKFVEIGMKKFNASQVFDWLHNKLVFNFDEFSNISKKTRLLI